jgi:hypothetical protein
MAVRLSISWQAVDQIRQRFEATCIIETEKTKRGLFFRWLLHEEALPAEANYSGKSLDPF